MIYKLIAPLLSPYYRLIRGVASLASKLFFFYALLVAMMAFAAERGIEAFPIYTKWIVCSILLRAVIMLADHIARRIRGVLARPVRV